MISIGQIVAEQYEIREIIGSGGFSTVYLAYDHMLARTVAVKALKVELTRDTTFLSNFRTEAQLVARLDHPNILQVYTFGLHDHTPFLVTPYISGGSLKRKLDQRRRFGLEEVGHVLRQLASALDYAHANRLIHRDIKPQNVLLHADGRLVLGDFGVAKLVSAPDAASNTRPSGTIAYMAPELFKGEVSRAADIYALGVVVFQMLTGNVPFTGTPEQIMYQHLTETPPTLRTFIKDAPEAVEVLLNQVLDKNPAIRPDMAGDFAALYDMAVPPTRPVRVPGQTDYLAVAPPQTRELSQSMPDKDPEHPSAPGVRNKQSGILFRPLGKGRSPAPAPAPSAQPPGPSAPVIDVVPPPQPVVQIDARSLLRTLERQGGAVNSLAFGRGGRIIATGGADGRLRLWEVESGTLKETLTGHTQPITCVAYAPNGNYIATGSADHKVRLWDTQNIHAAPHVFEGHSQAVSGVGFDARTLDVMSISRDKTLAVWEARFEYGIRNAKGLDCTPTAFAPAPNVRLIAVGATDGRVGLWDLRTGFQTRVFTSHRDEVTGVAFTPDGRSLASVSRDTTVRVYDMKTAHEIAVLYDHTDAINGVAFSPDNTRMATVSNDMTVRLWNVETWALVETISAAEPVLCVAFSPDNSLLAGGTHDGYVRLWRLK